MTTIRLRRARHHRRPWDGQDFYDGECFHNNPLLQPLTNRSFHLVSLVDGFNLPMA